MNVSENTEIFDIQSALKRMEGDQELLVDMIEIFLEDYPNQIAAIREALAGNHADDLSNAAHALKGSVGNFGARRSFLAAQNLEQIARDRKSAEYQAAFDTLMQELATLEPALKAVSA